MAVPRPLLLALIGVALIGATFFASQGARKTAAEPSAPAIEKIEVADPAPPKPAKPRKAQAKAPAKPEAAAAKKPQKRSTPAASAAAKASPEASKPLAVARAIKAGKVVVLFFSQPGSADDGATTAAVRAVERGGNRAVFTDRIDNLARYGPIVAAVGVAQAPAVVIVDKQRRPRLLEGFLDGQTLRQEVADAAR